MPRVDLSVRDARAGDPQPPLHISIRIWLLLSFVDAETPYTNNVANNGACSRGLMRDPARIARRFSTLMQHTTLSVVCFLCAGVSSAAELLTLLRGLHGCYRYET